jgi:tetratricopeptide (TPR) repeat protein
LPALALAGLLLAVSPAAQADQADPRLDALFSLLKETQNPLEARIAESQIWQLWMTSDDATVNLLMGRGVDAMSAQDLKGAFKIFTEMIQIAPDFAEAWNKRATVLYLLGAYPESIADIDRTLELEPRHFGALSGLGLCNAELEHDEAALDAFQRALSVNPHMDSVRANAEMIQRRIDGNKI